MIILDVHVSSQLSPDSTQPAPSPKDPIFVAEDGTFEFRDDIYERDARLAAAMASLDLGPSASDPLHLANATQRNGWLRPRQGPAKRPFRKGLSGRG